MADSLCVDLTAFRPAALKDGCEVEAIWPSFCLPWFPGEEPLVGEVARRHRRSSDPAAWEEEARLDLERRGRFHFAEGWLAMTREPDSLQPSNAIFGWTPTGDSKDRVEVSFAEVIRAVLRRWAAPNCALALIVPDGLGPGPRQEILDRIESDFASVQLVPRSVAGAMTWCRSPEADRAVACFRGAGGQRMGSVLVTTTAADTWEAAVVPIRFEGEDSDPPICPIHERVRYRSEIGGAGLERCVPKSLQIGGAGSDEIWASWLHFAGQRFRFAEDGSDWKALSNAFSRWSIPATVDRAWKPADATEEIVRIVEVTQRESRLLGWTHVDSSGEGEVPAKFDFLNDFALSDPRFVGEDSMLEAGLSVLRWIAAVRTPYYESLAKVDLYVEGRNEYQDPVAEWRPLIEATEVPVGRVYDSPQPIRGLSLPAGEIPKITLFVRSERRGKQALGSFLARQSEPQPTSAPVQIEARLKPGQGLVRFVVESIPKGGFRAEVRESQLDTNAKEPGIQYSWPPGSAWVVPNRSHVGEFLWQVQEFRNAFRRASVTEEDIRRVRQSMNIWLSPNYQSVRVSDLDVPSYISRDFVYLGVVPSAKVATGELHNAIMELSDLLEAGFRRAGPQGLRDQFLWCASWLYCYAPKGILDKVCTFLNTVIQPPRPALAVAGNCFCTSHQYECFFQAMDRFMSEECDASGIEWVRAYRNLARFRADALSLDVLPQARQTRIFQWYLNVFRSTLPSPQGSSFGHCARLAPHLLKRRRFDNAFLEPGSGGFEMFDSLLDNALRRRTKWAWRENLTAAKEFLHSEASRVTLQRLGAADGG